MHVSKRTLILAAAKACKSFASSSERFFNFEKRRGWRGWENWLTVDITRRLNNNLVLPFYPYSCVGLNVKTTLDIYVDLPVRLAVEIKVNYIDDDEIANSEEHRSLPDRVFKDALKIAGLDRRIDKLLVISTCFESRPALEAYQNLVKDDLAQRFTSFQHRRWYDCSAGTGHNLLLALSSSPGFPRSP